MTVEANFTAAIGGFDLEVNLEADDEIVVLYGRSGVGKSLTLQCIAGLLSPDRGRIAIGGRTVFDGDAGIDFVPQRRRVGYVVQDLALFPHMSVRANVLIGVERDQSALRLYDTLRTLLSIDGLDDRRPHQLSGGQQQRVALARALVRPADVLLLDEPFSSVDDALRADLRAELVRLQKELHLPIIFVTHDLREAHLLADRIAVIDSGRVLQFATRDEVFRRPRSRRVAALTGISNVFPGVAKNGSVIVAGLALTPMHGAVEGEAVDIAIRAERCNLRRLDPNGELPPNCFVAHIVSELAFGNTHTLHLEPEAAGPAIEVEVASRPYEVLGLASQRRWVVELPAADLHVMPSEAPAPDAGAE